MGPVRLCACRRAPPGPGKQARPRAVAERPRGHLETPCPRRGRLGGARPRAAGMSPRHPANFGPPPDPLRVTPRPPPTNPGPPYGHLQTTPIPALVHLRAISWATSGQSPGRGRGRACAAGRHPAATLPRKARGTHGARRGRSAEARPGRGGARGRGRPGLLTEAPRGRAAPGLGRRRPTARLSHCSGAAAGGGRASPRAGAPNPGVPRPPRPGAESRLLHRSPPLLQESRRGDGE